MTGFLEELREKFSRLTKFKSKKSFILEYRFISVLKSICAIFYCQIFLKKINSAQDPRWLLYTGEDLDYLFWVR